MNRAQRANETWNMVVEKIGDVEFVNALQMVMPSDVKELYLKKIMRDFEIENEYKIQIQI